MPCSPGMRACHAKCLHRERAQDYRRERARQLLVAESRTHGYATELAEWFEQRPLLTFKDWLIATATPAEVRRTA